MKIDGINGANTQIGGMNRAMANDPVSKSIQKQIANAQKKLQDLAVDQDMSMEEKMKKRQEVQQQIMDLNNQLRQHQIEQRKEKQQKKESSMDNMLGGSKKAASKTGNQSTGLSQASMKAMISADSAMEQARVQGSVASRMEGRAGVLEAEIKLDTARGDDVEAKKEELAEVQEKAVKAESAQMNTLVDANKELEEAAKADRQTEKTKDGGKKAEKGEAVSGKKDDKKITGGKGSEVSDTKTAELTDAEGVMEGTDIGMTGTDKIQSAEISMPAAGPGVVRYTPVDVRL